MNITNMPRSRKILKQIIWILTIIFVLMNVVAYFHAYKFTHFNNEVAEKTKSPEKLSVFEKLSTLLFGVNNPRPTNKIVPMQNFQTVSLQSNKKIECWYIKSADSVRGTVIIFHGYSGDKSSMLGKSNEILNLGYNTFVVDFIGSGGSEGNQTTLGYKESAEVKTAYDYIKEQGETNIYLFGTSMGAVAILKAINDYNITPKGIIIESPFGSMYQTTSARFKIMGVPAFPMSGLLVFWGGVQNGFWAFGHNPTDYAEKVNCPTLLLYGEKDENVSKTEISEIYTNIRGPKVLKTYELAGHENFLIKYKSQWTQDISDFLAKN